jgi:hypothetical protein
MADENRGDESRDRYPPDQQFGEAAAEDQEKVDRGEQPPERPEKPRAGNKAEPQ